MESMACGIPVLTSLTSSLPEVAGDAAILVDPLSEDAITKGISRLINDSELRKHLIQKGLCGQRGSIGKTWLVRLKWY